MENKFNIPNILSYIRLLLSIPLFVFIYTGNTFGALITLLLAAITELDGTIARRYNQVTVYGSILDPVVDGIFLTSGFIALILVGKISILLLAILGLTNLPRLIYMRLHMKKNGDVKSSALSKTSAFLITLIIPLAIISLVYLNYYIIFMILLSGIIMIQRGSSKKFA